MGYLAETKMKLPLPRLEYSEVENVLTVGDLTLPLESSWLEGKSPWNIVDFEGPNQLEDSLVCLNPYSHLIGTRLFHEQLGKIKDKSEIIEGTVRVIRTVFTELEPHIEIPDVSNSGPFGFNMQVTPENFPRLWTYGNCACLGPDATGFWVDSSEWEDGLCQYNWHNIDADSQAWSLLAGIGHLARLCKEASF